MSYIAKIVNRFTDVMIYFLEKLIDMIGNVINVISLNVVSEKTFSQKIIFGADVPSVENVGVKDAVF